MASHGLLDPAEVAAGGGVGFNRSPQVHVAFPEQSLVAPVPPQPPDRHRFPLISLLIPLLLAGALYAVFRPRSCWSSWR